MARFCVSVQSILRSKPGWPIAIGLTWALVLGILVGSYVDAEVGSGNVCLSVVDMFCQLVRTEKPSRTYARLVRLRKNCIVFCLYHKAYAESWYGLKAYEHMSHLSTLCQSMIVQTANTALSRTLESLLVLTIHFDSCIVYHIPRVQFQRLPIS